MATYYVSTTGSNTAPYDTWAKAANAIATVLARIKTQQVTGNVVYVAAGEYTVNGAPQISLDSAYFASLSIIGAGKDRTIYSGDNNGLDIYATNGSDIRVEGMRFRVTGARYAFRKVAGGNGTTLRDVAFEALDGSTIGTLCLIQGDTSMLWERVDIYWGANGTVVGISSGQVNMTARWCVSQCKQVGAAAISNGPWVINGPATVNIDHCLLLDSRIHGLWVTNASSIVNVRNSIVQGGTDNSAASGINRTAGTVNVNNSLTIGPPRGPALGKTISGTVTETNSMRNVYPRFSRSGRVGFILPHVDDSSNYEYAKLLEAELAARGMRGSYYVEPYYYSTPCPDVELQGFVSRGVMEVCSHTLSHCDLAFTHCLRISQTGGTSPRVTWDGSTLTLACNEGAYTQSMDCTAATNVGQIIAAMNGVKGWTVAKSSTGGQTAANIYDKCLASSMAYCTAKDAPCDIDFDRTAGTGRFFVNELSLSKSIIEGVIGNAIDPQTGARYACNSLGAPYNSQDAASITFARDIARYANFRAASVETNGLLASIDLYKIHIMNASLMVGANEAETRANAAAVAVCAAINGMVFSVIAHKESECSIANWKIMLDVWKGISDLQVTSHQIFCAYIRGGSWAEVTPGVYQRSWAVDPNGLCLRSGSPLYRAGADIGLTLDRFGSAFTGTPSIGIHSPRTVRKSTRDRLRP